MHKGALFLYLHLRGFDWDEHVKFVDDLGDCGAAGELREYLAAVEAAVEDQDDKALELNIRLLRVRRRDIETEPEILRDRRRQNGTRKPRRPELQQWIDEQVKRKPAAKSPALWKTAPEWITEQVGFDRFSKRVTTARKKLQGRK